MSNNPINPNISISKSNMFQDLKIVKSNFVNYKNGSITNDYHMGKSIGSGAYGTVKSAYHKFTKQTRAVKVLKKINQDENRLFLEVDILAKLSHGNIMQIFEFYEDDANFYLISEHCAGGELFDCISSKGIFSEREACSIIKQILSAICYSHENNIVHRDLKPENILLADGNFEKPILKIIDWGGGIYLFIFLKKMK